MVLQNLSQLHLRLVPLPPTPKEIVQKIFRGNI